MERFLPEICTIQYGFPFDSAKFSTTGGMPLIRIRDVVRGYSETYTTEEYKEEYVVNKDDLLIGMDGEFNIAKWGETPALLNQRVCRLLPTPDVDKNYLFYFMPSALKRIEAKTPFVTVKHLSAKELNKVRVPLPPLEEQRRIAALLDKVTDLIAKRRAQLDKLDLLVKARFVEMFGDPLMDTGRYPKVPLGSLAEVGSSKRIFEKEYVREGVPFYRTKEIVELSKRNRITTELFITRQRYEEIRREYGVPKAGDLLISAVGTIGVIWIVDGKNDFYFKDGNLLRVATSEKFAPIYLKHLLEALIGAYKLEMSAGTAYAALTISALKEMLIYEVPIGEQKQFAAFTEQIDMSKLAIQQSLEKLETLKKTLMQQYFG